MTGLRVDDVYSVPELVAAVAHAVQRAVDRDPDVAAAVGALRRRIGDDPGLRSAVALAAAGAELSRRRPGPFTDALVAELTRRLSRLARSARPADV